MKGHDAGDEIIRETTFRGRRVVLRRQTWVDHILVEHPEMWSREGETIAAINEAIPDHRYGDREFDTRVHFYIPDAAGVTRWLRTIVEFDADPPRVVSSQLRRRLPRNLERYEP